LNRATLGRLELIDLLLTATDSILIMLRDVGNQTHASAAARLSELKGPSAANLRGAHHLRSAIRAGDGLFNFLHSPDDIPEVVRELGVLLPAPERRNLLARTLSSSGSQTSVEQKITELYSGAPVHDLTLETTCENLTRSFALRGHRFDRDAVVRQVRGRRSLSGDKWRAIVAAMQVRGIEVPLWDQLNIAVRCTECNLPGVEPIL
jgi:hypothetical protein